MASNERLLNLYDSLSVAVLVVDRNDGTLKFLNKKVYQDLMAPEGSLLNKNYIDVFWPEFHKVYLDLVEQCEKGEAPTTIYYWAEKVIWEQITATLVSWDAKNDAIMLNITNITDVAQAQAEAERLTYFENLTGLPNGKKLEKDINELVSVEQVTLLYIQLTNIENINDFYGWDTGDKVLLLIRDWILETEKVRAQLYRGEKGFILLGRNTTKEQAFARIHEIEEAFGKPWVVEEQGTKCLIYCEIKIGAVFGKYIKNEMRSLLLRTMNVEPNGDFHFRVYDEEADKKLKQEHELKSLLTHSMYHDMEGFSVQFLPIVEARTTRWIGLEALCRWTFPQGATVPPLEFIPILEQQGLIGKLDNWVRKQAMQQCSDLGLQNKQMVLNVNYSPSQPLGGDFADTLYNMTQETGFLATRLVLEITEDERMRFDETSLEGLELLKEKGFSLSIDDFGSGYSSIENLIKIAAATIKTDKMIIDDLEHDADRQYLIQTLIELAHHLDMLIVVEGVETPEQKTLLEGYGADCMQGFLFSKPLSFEQLAQETYRFDDV